MQIPYTALLTVSFVLGAIFGSFVTMASWRLPRHLSWGGRSQCPHCRKFISIKALVPVFSWFIYRGQSACCGQKIFIRYPLIELATGFFFMISAWHFGLTFDLLLVLFLTVVLLMMTVIDLEHQILPDSLNVVLAVSGVAWQVWRGENILSAVAAGLILGGIAWLLAIGMEKFLKRETLGGGDVKFLAAAGIWAGFWNVPWLLIYGGLLGIALGLLWRVVKKENIFPFGPALCLALYVIVVFGGPVLP